MAPHPRLRPGPLSAALLAALALLSPLPAAAQEIGTVAVVSPQLTGTPPGGARRALGLRASVVSNEVIETGPTGRAQLLFLDQSTLSIAPSTSLTLDRFVYDPQRQTGEMGIRLATGALRFIGGQTSRDRDAVIRTPGATLGIRGSSVLVQHIGNRTIAVLIAGENLCITAGAQDHCTSRRGGVLTENGYQGRVTQEFLATLLQQVDGAPSQLAAGNGAGSGTGLQTQAPPHRQPLSSGGREQDAGVFDRSVISDLLLRRFPDVLGGAPPSSTDCSEMFLVFGSAFPIEEFGQDFWINELGFPAACFTLPP
jgi:hypothetical protein